MMKKGLFYDLYDRLRQVNFRSYPPDKLSGFLHGYLTVYTMVRIYPWLEADFGTPYDIHERAKEIARWYEVLVQREDLPVDPRLCCGFDGCLPVILGLEFFGEGSGCSVRYSDSLGK